MVLGTFGPENDALRLPCRREDGLCLGKAVMGLL